MSSIPGQVPVPSPSPTQGRKESSKGRTEEVRQSLHTHLRKTAGFIKILDALVQVFGWIACLLLVWLVACVLDHWILPLPTALRWFFWTGMVLGSTWWVVRYLVPLLFRRINLTYAAKRIEHLVPEFKNGLISWLELESLPEHGVPKGVMAALAYRAKKFIGGQDPSATVDTSPLIKLIGCVLLLLTSLVVYTMISPKSVMATGKRIAFPWAVLDAPARVQFISVKPGDIEITQGKPLEVDVELRGLRFSEPVIVRFNTLDGQLVNQVVELAPLTEGFHYTGEVSTGSHGIEQEIEYFVEAGDAVSGPHRVTLNPLPSVVLESVLLEFPEYTKLPPRTVSGGAAEAVEGTMATVLASANQPLDRGRLEINPEVDDRGELVRADAFVDMQVDGKTLTAQWLLKLNSDGDNPTKTGYRIRGYNERGDANPRPIQHEMSILADVAPEITLVGPDSRLLRVIPTSRVNIEVRASDPDFGLAKLELEIRKNGLVVERRVLLDGPGVLGRQVKTTQLDIAAFKGTERDRFQLVARASDNRHDPVSRELAANEAASEPLTLEVVGPEEPFDVGQQPPVPPEPPAGNNSDSEKDPEQPKNSGEEGESGDDGERNSNAQRGATETKQGGQEQNAEQANRDSSTGNSESSTSDSSDQSAESGSNSSDSSAGGESDGTSQTGETASDPGNQSGGGSNAGQEQSSSSSADANPSQSGNRESEGQDGTQNSGGSSSSSESANSDSNASNSRTNSDSTPNGSGDRRSDNDATRSSEPNPGQGQSEQLANDRDTIKRVQEYMQSEQGTQGGRSSQQQDSSRGENQTASNQQRSETNDAADRQNSPKNPRKDVLGQPDPRNTNQRSDTQSGAQQSGDQRPDAENQQSSGQQSSGDQSSGDQSSTNNPSAEQDANSTGASQSDNSADSNASPQDPTAEQNSAEQNSAEQNSTEKNSTGDPSGPQDETGNQTQNTNQGDSGDQNSGDQNSGNPTGNSEQASNSNPDASQQGTQQENSGQPDPASGSQSGAQSDPQTGQQDSANQSGSESNSQSGNQSSDQSGDQNQNNQSGGQQSGGQQSGGQQSGGQQSGGQQSGGQQSGGQQSGGQQSGGQQSGGQQSGGQQSGGQQSGGQQSGGQQSGDQQSGGQQSGGQQSGGQQSGGQQSGGQQSGGQQSGGQQSGGQQSGGQQSGGQQSGGQQSGGQQSGGQQSGGQQSGGQQSGGQQSGGQQSGGQQSGGQQSGGQQSGGQQSGGQQSGGQQSGGQQSGGQPGSQAGPSSGGGGSVGRGGSSGGGSGPAGEGGDTGTSDAVNQEYADRNTQMVLDYLDRQRDQPDPELLKELNWSENDLRSFVDRWKNARDLAADSDNRIDSSEELDDLRLQSSGYDPREGSSINDDFQQMRDGGTRFQPPQSLRKPYEAFRRAIEESGAN